ncbi:MAG: hypothetical protein H0V97_01690 [Actinobacteria bacterium]|nr:hypothetical protein [Actinomycetota bacterium]
MLNETFVNTGITESVISQEWYLLDPATRRTTHRRVPNRRWRSTRLWFDYVAEEVLDDFPMRTQQFLLRESILRELS